MSFMTFAVGCSSVKDNTPDAFEDYPTFDGEWNEMTYSPAETRFQGMGAYRKRSAGAAVRKRRGRLYLSYDNDEEKFFRRVDSLGRG